MKRRLLIVAVFLLAGAVVNVVVAWVAVALPTWAELRFQWDEIDEHWPVPVPEHWPPCDRQLSKKTIGLRADQWSTDIVDREQQSSEYFSVTIVRCGLPAAALRWHWISESAFGGAHAGNRFEGHPEPSWWHQGIRVSESFPLVRESFSWKALPLRPIWPGFAVNTLLYATVLWLLIPGPFALRRFIRVRRGLCPACRYPMGESPVCSECGKALPGRAKVTT